MKSRDRVSCCWIIATAAVMTAAGCNSGDTPLPPDPAVTDQGIGITGPGGWLYGTVHVAGFTGGISVPQPDTSVFAQNAVTMVNTPVVVTDLHGGFRIPAANGNYRICWAKPSYTSGCTPSLFNINNRSRSVGVLAMTITQPRKLRGSAYFSSGGTCVIQDPFMSTNIVGKAELLTTANVVVASTRLNFRGDWVLPDPGRGHKVRVTCGALSTESSTAGMSPDLPFVFTWNNARPIVRPLAATVNGVDVTQGVLPGTVIQLSTAVLDADGNPMTLRWRAQVGTLVDTATVNATWTVPSIPGTYAAYFSASDDRGGYTSRSVQVRVRTVPEVVFIGSVRDDGGGVIAGATVTVGGATTTSKADGLFQLTVPESTSYLLNISKAGYAEFSRPVRRATRGEPYTLTRASATPINPGVVNVITDNRERWIDPCAPAASCRRTPGRVTIPANALLLEPPPIGGLTAYIATYDATTEPLPGNQTAINTRGEATSLISYGALFIEIRDAAGTKYNLAPGKTATVEIPFQQAIGAQGAPPAMDMWKYDTAKGMWIERATAGVRVGNSYVVEVPNFSTQNADIEFATPACLYIDLDSSVFNVYQLKARLQVPEFVGGPVRVYEMPLDQVRNTVYALPQAVPYTLEIFDIATSQSVLTQTLTGLLGGWWGGAGDPGTNDPDCVVQTVTQSDVIGGEAFNRFLQQKGIGDLAQAQAYYATIDPSNLRTTLGGFWAQNGFTGTGGGADAAATFINFNDLGFGRDMHCRQNGAEIACYVTNYGGSNQAPANYTLADNANVADRIATVAMEYSAVTVGSPIVKFYAFAGGVAASPRITSADLDGAGPKFVPNLCLQCHGGTYLPANPVLPTVAEVNMGASFREFDIYSYRDGAYANGLATGLTQILAQEPAFFDLNQRVLASAPQTAISELINIWYPTSAPPFNQNAVPVGWASQPGLYLNVVAKACRTCHAAQENAFSTDKAWASFAQFQNAKPVIQFVACTGDPAQPNWDQVKRFRFMPHANVTFKNFWLDPSAYSALGTFTGWGASINSDPFAECTP